MPLTIDIITCPQWNARPPRNEPVLVGKSTRSIIHHTAGHHPEIENPKDESREEAIAYARAIQNFHMDGNGWSDSGHNFLVCRNGLILQGRWMTVTAIQHKRMVVSAHCPGQNDQVGVEHEHLGDEAMTAAQRESSARLQAWIAYMYGRQTVLSLAPHSRYFPTSCPANLLTEIPAIRERAQWLLNRALAT